MLAAVAVVECDGMRACDIEDDKVFWTGERAGTRTFRVANLIAQSEVLERVFIEKFPVPSLNNNVM